MIFGRSEKKIRRVTSVRTMNKEKKTTELIGLCNKKKSLKIAITRDR